MRIAIVDFGRCGHARAPQDRSTDCRGVDDGDSGRRADINRGLADARSSPGPDTRSPIGRSQPLPDRRSIQASSGGSKMRAAGRLRHVASPPDDAELGLRGPPDRLRRGTCVSSMPASRKPEPGRKAPHSLISKRSTAASIRSLVTSPCREGHDRCHGSGGGSACRRCGSISASAAAMPASRCAPGTASRGRRRSRQLIAASSPSQRIAHHRRRRA